MGNNWQLETTSVDGGSSIEDASILHQYKLTCNFKLPMGKNIKENFLMTKYNNMKLVEYFLVMAHFLFKQTKKRLHNLILIKGVV
jgi:hypothetical protein